MTYEAAYKGARAFSVEKQRTVYLIAREDSASLADDRLVYSWCTLDRWSKYERAGWKYVTMVTEQSEPYSEAFVTA